MDIRRYLDDLRARFADLSDGDPPAYLESLTAEERGRFSIAVATCDGQLEVVGEPQACFALQSMAKPFAYGLALEKLGRDEVLARISAKA